MYFNAHSMNMGPIPVLETVILMQLPVLIRRLKEIVPNFAGTIIVKGWRLYLSDNAVHR